jgi:molybdopterin synthase catalytic subunit
MKIYIELTHQPIVIPAASGKCAEVGAQVDFQGIVRGSEDGISIKGLYYEAHEPMARSELERIIFELALLHPCEQVWIMHRLDYVPVGELALFVRVQSSHRKSALLLTDELIDRIKQDVPIWKSVEQHPGEQ